MSAELSRNLIFYINIIIINLLKSLPQRNIFKYRQFCYLRFVLKSKIINFPIFKYAKIEITILQIFWKRKNK